MSWGISLPDDRTPKRRASHFNCAAVFELFHIFDGLAHGGPS
jgi:hypothetical protein